MELVTPGSVTVAATSKRMHGLYGVVHNPDALISCLYFRVMTGQTAKKCIRDRGQARDTHSRHRDACLALYPDEGHSECYICRR